MAAARVWTALVSLLVVPAAPGSLHAQGHGPAYGLSTPTLGRGGWSLDVGGMGRWLEGGGRAVMLRPMLGYGISEDLQLSASWPVRLSSTEGLPPGRGMSRMATTPDVELLAAWRFHRRATAVGARFESTAFAGLVVPTDDRRNGLDTAPGLYAALATGYASRSVYAWLGGLYRRYASPGRAGGDRLGDVAMYSLVIGYRPPYFREDLPHPDWRLFIEAIGERVGPATRRGSELPGSSRHQIFVGPTVLGLFGAWGISGGPVLPVYRDLNGVDRGDRVRLVVNTTFWF